MGRIFDDRDNRMSPSHVVKRGIKYRYYISSALLKGRAAEAGSISRVPAVEIETLAAGAIRECIGAGLGIDDKTIIMATCPGSPSARAKSQSGSVMTGKHAPPVLMTSFECHDRSSHPNAAVKSCCRHLATVTWHARSVRKPAPPSLPQSSAGAAGWKSSLRTAMRLPRLLLTARAAAPAR